MDWIADPTIWAGLAALILLELVLGIDNLVFIAILAEKLPAALRDCARLVGLSLTLIMRLLLLACMSWLVSLTAPLFTAVGHTFSARDLIMSIGGIFLIFKATMELNERLEGRDNTQQTQNKGAHFWPVVAQIVILDAVFSLDSVITAIGMVDHLPTMMAAVVVAILVMMLASKPLTRFIHGHPTIVILCLSFLLMIGFSLVADGFGYAIPKGYLYAAIGFSVLIEALNQLAQYNRRRFLSTALPLRQRTAAAILRMLSGRHEEAQLEAQSLALTEGDSDGQAVFNEQERRMIEQVLGMAQRTVSSVMTSRHDIETIDLREPPDVILPLLTHNQHTRLVITEDSASNEPLGVVHVIDLLAQLLRNEPLDIRALTRQPLVFPEQLSLLLALEQFREAHTHFAFIVDEFGSVEGIITLSDIMETIAGNLPLENETLDPRYDIRQNDDGTLMVNGYIPLEDLVGYISLQLEERREYHTLAGLLMEHSQSVPKAGDRLSIDNYLFEIMEMDSHRIIKVLITPVSLRQSAV